MSPLLLDVLGAAALLLLAGVVSPVVPLLAIALTCAVGAVELLLQLARLPAPPRKEA